MSYCRFSSDNWLCDVYCYEDVYGGYTTHVAGNRIVGDIPQVPLITKTDNDAFFKAHKAQMEFLNNANREPIGLAYDSESFNDPDLDSFMSRLATLKEAGYNVPDYVFDMVEEEIVEERVENDKGEYIPLEEIKKRFT